MKLRVSELGAGPPICLLHGLFGAGRNLGVVARALAPRHRVLLPDLRNHGRSPHAATMTYAEMAADIRETLAAAGALPAALLGHSMGGKVAMRLALDDPDAVTRVLVADIAPIPYPPHFRGPGAAMLALPLVPGLTRVAASAQLAAAIPDDALRAFLLQGLDLADPPVWRIGLAEIMRNLTDIESWDVPPGARYDGPTLFLAAGRSDYVTETARPAIRALFPAARFATLKDAGHWLHADQPAAFNAAATAFFNPA